MSKLELAPFSKRISEQYRVWGGVQESGSSLILDYQIKGPVTSLHIPVKVDLPHRKTDLWKTTCFEFFICNILEPWYLEFNFSPSGCWNCFYFEDYRKGMKELVMGERDKVEVKTQVSENSLSLKALIQLSPGREFARKVVDPKDLRAQLSVILCEQNGTMSYWALKHGGSVPDFHIKENFQFQSFKKQSFFLSHEN